MANLLENLGDDDLLREVIEGAQAVAKDLETTPRQDIRLPFFYTGYLNEMNNRIAKDGLAAHPLFRAYAVEMAKLDDAAADNVFDVSLAIQHLTAPPKLEREFESVSGRLKGAPPPENPFRAMAALKPTEKPLQVLPTVKINKRSPGV